MNYRITCVCGHQFQVGDEQVRQEVECPVCRQRLKPSVGAATSPAAPAQVPPAAPAVAPAAATIPAAMTPPPPVAPDPAAPVIEPTKRCPFCGEVILAIARKCKHCGEFLDRAPAPPHDPAIQPGTAAAALAPNAAGQSNAAPSTNAANSADPVYNLNSSQWDNFWRFVSIGVSYIFFTLIWWLIAIKLLDSGGLFFAGALGGLVIGGFVGWFFYLRTHSTHIRIYPMRIDVESGILSKSLESLELFRVTDTELKQSFIERIVGIGTINLMSNDSTSEPELSLLQIPRAREVLKYLQAQIPIAARQRGAVYLEK